MNEMQRLKLIQEEYEAKKRSWGGDRKSSGEINHLKNNPDKTPKVRAELAKEHGINEGTVKTAVEVGRA